jgi:hypothetical protein
MMAGFRRAEARATGGAGFSPPLGFGLSWGNQSWLQAGFLGLCCEAGGNTCELVSGLFGFDGGLKGRLQARLPAPLGFSPPEARR